MLRLVRWATRLPETPRATVWPYLQLATICPKWKARYRDEWQSPVGLSGFDGSAPAIVAAAQESCGGEPKRFLKSSCRQDFITQRWKLDVAAQPDAKRREPGFPSPQPLGRGRTIGRGATNQGSGTSSDGRRCTRSPREGRGEGKGDSRLKSGSGKFHAAPRSCGGSGVLRPKRLAEKQRPPGVSTRRAFVSQKPR